MRNILYKIDYVIDEVTSIFRETPEDALIDTLETIVFSGESLKDVYRVDFDVVDLKLKIFVPDEDKQRLGIVCDSRNGELNRCFPVGYLYYSIKEYYGIKND